MRAAIRQMEKYSAQTRLLCRHKIKTPEQLSAFIDGRKQEKSALIKERERVYNRLKTAKKHDAESPEKVEALYAQRDELSEKIKVIGKELYYADDIFKRQNEIRENSVLIPAVARLKGDGYELIAGHRRKFACQILGIETMPVLVREMTNEQAVIAMVNSNVQRENILPSENAFAYKMKLEAVKKQGQRSDLTSCQVAPCSAVSRGTLWNMLKNPKNNTCNIRLNSI
jgi:ParB-like chromosome segregation protein Spo0J